MLNKSLFSLLLTFPEKKQQNISLSFQPECPFLNEMTKNILFFLIIKREKYYFILLSVDI